MAILESLQSPPRTAAATSRTARRLPPIPATAALPRSPRVSVVIPARDEALNLPLVLAELPAGLHEVVLVDGGSVDGTVAAARRARPDVRVVHQTRRGKGNALVCGIAACTGDIAILLDADYSADPDEIAVFVAKLREGADLVKGSRFLGQGGSSDLTALRRLGNKTLLFLMNRLYRTSFSDLCYGYNALWTRCFRDLELPSTGAAEAQFGDGFEFETVLAAHAATARLEIGEVPSFERDRQFGESHLNTWRDGLRVLRAILRERLPSVAAHPAGSPGAASAELPRMAPVAVAAEKRS